MADIPTMGGKHSFIATWAERIIPSAFAAALTAGIVWGVTIQKLEDIGKRIADAEVNIRSISSASLDRRVTEIETYVREDRAAGSAVLQRLAAIDVSLAAIAKEQAALRTDVRAALRTTDRRTDQRSRGTD